jgi:hypothetical protein
MEALSRGRGLAGPLGTAFCGLALLGASACTAVTSEDPGETTGVAEQALTGGWTTLTLANNWTNQPGTTAAIGKINSSTLVFRGQLNGTASTGPKAFYMPAAFHVPDTVELRMVMAGTSGGNLHIDLSDYSASVEQDGVEPHGPGQEGKYFSSLDGLSYDVVSTSVTPLSYGDSGDWVFLYGHRHGGMETWAVSAKVVNGFVRLQGFLKKAEGANPNNMYLFNIPPAHSTPPVVPALRPGQTVYVPVSLGGDCGAQQAYGRLVIYSNGDVYVQPENGNNAAANCGVSFEGVSYSLSSNGTDLPLMNGWHAYSSRKVRYRNDNGVVRFEGAISGGTSFIIANLPSGFRPPTTVYLPADSYGATRARIVVTSTGFVSVDVPAVSTASGFLSLDSVSFPL